MTPRRQLLLALAFAVAATWLAPLGRELYVGDETKYAQVVREMRAGSFFVPTLGGTPFTHKPPVHFWIVGALTYVFGLHSIWPFVLPSLAALAFLAWFLARWGGLVSAFVCATAIMIWGSAQTARMDVEFTALLAVGAFLMQRFFERDDFRALLWSAVAFGVALVVKGPMAPVIALCLFAFEGIRRRRVPRGNYFAPAGALLAIPLLWLVPTILVAGEAWWKEVFFKQTVGRAVGAWVHKSPPWFYLVHGPADIFPWFLLFAVALFAIYRRKDETAKFHVSWLLAVLVPYSIVSSKLDVYMMALIPPVALIVGSFIDAPADAFTRRGILANRVMLGVLALIGIAALFLQPSHIRGEDAYLAGMWSVKAMFAVLVAVAIAGLLFARRLVSSTIAVGLAPIAAFVYAAVFLVPIANEMVSTRPLVRALEAQRVAPEEIALHVAPHLWIRGMEPSLARARHVDPDDLRQWRPQVIVTRRRNTEPLAEVLRDYRKVAELRMIGKWFDVYRR